MAERRIRARQVARVELEELRLVLPLRRQHLAGDGDPRLRLVGPELPAEDRRALSRDCAFCHSSIASLFGDKGDDTAKELFT
ncbi:MAG: hypothetical protein KJ062_11460 [Thermoanaerobaculia bacterium]|nr:hypothetical protein [Thermoanaerobaculia bacterium]